MTEDFVVRQCNQRSMKKALIWLLPGGFGPIRRLFFLTFFHRCCSVCLDLTKAASLLGQCHFNTGWREDIKADKKKREREKDAESNRVSMWVLVWPREPGLSWWKAETLLIFPVCSSLWVCQDVFICTRTASWQLELLTGGPTLPLPSPPPRRSNHLSPAWQRAWHVLLQALFFNYTRCAEQCVRVTAGSFCPATVRSAPV